MAHGWVHSGGCGADLPHVCAQEVQNQIIFSSTYHHHSYTTSGASHGWQWRSGKYLRSCTCTRIPQEYVLLPLALEGHSSRCVERNIALVHTCRPESPSEVVVVAQHLEAGCMRRALSWLHIAGSPITCPLLGQLRPSCNKMLSRLQSLAQVAHTKQASNFASA